ncbi:MAG: putative alpha/beta-hydrolase family hydrolase [Alphaproteobacteria bacterium]|jgi:predicted alpha/beta-hydrolase family hydrolase
MTNDWLIDGPDNTPATIVLAHGAGAMMDTPFMGAMASGLAAAGLRVVRFEFPYMAKRRHDGKRRPPDRKPVLLESWRQMITALGPVERLIVGGKSMGGRIASELAAGEHAELGITGVACLGYPFHPAGKPDKLRTEHLRTFPIPLLIVQGERDALGAQPEVAGYDLDKRIEIVWLPDGDHSFKPRKKSGHTEEENLAAAIAAVTSFAIFPNL